MPISVFAQPGVRRVAASIRALTQAVLAAHGRRAGEITVMLTNDEELRALNREWRCIDRATDVLSFSYDDTAPGASQPIRTGKPARARIPVNGDVVISLDRMREQAERFDVTPGAELARLVVHGTLHLAGLDHRRAAERRHMRARED